MKKKFLIVIYLITISSSYAQNLSENWVLISSGNDLALYINVTGLSNYQDDEIYVWSLQELNPPMTMEEINGDIYKVKTYYLINKKLSRYSILQIIFYDEKDNVLKHYNYENKYENPEFKFSSPIVRNSDVYKILAKSLEFIKSDSEKK